MVKFTNEGLREAEYRREYLKQLEIQLPEIRNDLWQLWSSHQKTFGGFHARTRDFSRLEERLRDDNAEEYLLAFLRRPGEKTVPKREISQRLRSLKAFLRKYGEFCRTYYFEPEWLKKAIDSYFSLLFNLGKRPNIKPNQIRKFAKTIELPFLFTNVFRDIKGEDFSFQFLPWNATDDSNEYEVQIRNAFEIQLKIYIEKTTDHFKNKECLIRAKRVNLDHLKNLVEWNTSGQNTEFNDFLRRWGNLHQHERRYQDSLKSVREKMNIAFRRLRDEYGLPLKPTRQTLDKRI